MLLVFMVPVSRLKCMLPLIQCTLLYRAVPLIKVVTRKTRPTETGSAVFPHRTEKLN